GVLAKETTLPGDNGLILVGGKDLVVLLATFNLDLDVVALLARRRDVRHADVPQRDQVERPVDLGDTLGERQLIEVATPGRPVWRSCRPALRGGRPSLAAGPVPPATGSRRRSWSCASPSQGLIPHPPCP